MRAYHLNPGFEWNPLRKYRNVKCPCGCARKAKTCLGQADALPSPQVKDIKTYLRKLAAAGIIEARPGDIN